MADLTRGLTSAICHRRAMFAYIGAIISATYPSEDHTR